MKILRALRSCLAELGDIIRSVDHIALAVMSPSWLAMDAAGRPLTPVITHQDRRSVAIAHELEARVGKQPHLHIAGNRPFPGGISSTTCAWFVRHEPALMRRVDLIGHLNTFLLLQLTVARVVDPSNASFMGLYETMKLRGGWSDRLCSAVGISRSLLPDILESDQIAGTITAQASRRYGLTVGTPVLAGMVDTGAALLLTGARLGQMLNVSGTTDVLAICTDRPQPHERLLTRALGVGGKWTSVSTLASVGSTLAWAHQTLFSDRSSDQFHQWVKRLARRPIETAVTFDPYLGGDRMSIDQRSGAFTGLTLATKRQHMLSAIIESIVCASAERLPLLVANAGRRPRREVLVSGGIYEGIADLLYRDWPGHWTFRREPDATLRGLSMLSPRKR